MPGQAFVFVTRRDVPPTNNVSEQRLRPSVIFCKVTNGFRSAWAPRVTPQSVPSPPPAFYAA